MLWFNQSVLHYPGRCSVPRYLARPAPRFYSKVSNLALVSKISSANSYLISSNPESPAQLNFFADHSVLVDLVVGAERAGRVLTAPAAAPAAACCCRAGAALLLQCKGPGCCGTYSTWSVLQAILHSDAGSALL